MLALRGRNGARRAILERCHADDVWQRNWPRDLGVVPLPQEIDQVVGTAVTKLTRPAKAEVLVLVVEKNTFRVKPGDWVSTPLSGAAPGASITDGTGSLLLPEGSRWVLSAPDKITVVGSAAGSILTYYWV